MVMTITTIRNLALSLLNLLSRFAGGMLTKQAVFLSNKFLNDVNDSTLGGVTVSLPAGAPTPAVSQTLTGDKIVLDDATALALSDTTVGTLFGGIYMYVQTLSSATAVPARGTAAFWRATDLPGGATQAYQVTSDAQPTTTLPTFFAGVYLGALAKGNFGWIQIGGVASCLFDSAISAATVGGYVVPRGIAGVAATVASTFDVGAAVATPASVAIANAQIAGSVGVAIVLPVVSTVTTVLITRNAFARI
jgi:hypothetical protein